MSEEIKATPTSAAASTGELAMKAAADYCRNRGITQGLEQGCQVGIMVYALCEIGLIDGDDKAAKKLAFDTLYPLANGSALRHKLESERYAVLTKCEGKGRGKVDADKYTA